MSRTQAIAGVPVALAVARFRFAKLRRVRPRPYALADVPPDVPVCGCLPEAAVARMRFCASLLYAPGRTPARGR
jgi:hypothetical protein